MLTCVIQYELDPNRIEDFETYATAWPSIIERCGGDLLGYFLPAEGANDHALALINVGSLAEYEQYRQKLAVDPDARATVAHARRTECIRAERRSFLRPV